MDKKLNQLPEATAKKFKYTGPEGEWRWMHLHREVKLGAITPEDAKQLIEEGFPYLAAADKADKAAQPN